MLRSAEVFIIVLKFCILSLLPFVKRALDP
jgi:hypothetical protein